MAILESGRLHSLSKDADFIGTACLARKFLPLPKSPSKYPTLTPNDSISIRSNGIFIGESLGVNIARV